MHGCSGATSGAFLCVWQCFTQSFISLFKPGYHTYPHAKLFILLCQYGPHATSLQYSSSLLVALPHYCPTEYILPPHSAHTSSFCNLTQTLEKANWIVATPSLLTIQGRRPCFDLNTCGWGSI